MCVVCTDGWFVDCSQTEPRAKEAATSSWSSGGPSRLKVQQNQNITSTVVVVETLTSQSAFNYSANLFIWRLFGIRLASDLFRPLEPLLTCSTSRSVALFRETVARLAGREPPTAVPGPFPAKHLLCVLYIITAVNCCQSVLISQAIIYCDFHEIN